MKINFILPTNNANNFYSYFLSTIHHLDEIKQNIKICIGFQEPITDLEIDGAIQILKRKGFEVEHAHFKKEDRETFSCSMARKRIMYYSYPCDYYFFLDDNFKFNKKSAFFFKRAMTYLSNHKNCSVLNFRGSMGNKIRNTAIQPCIDGLISTGRGLFIKNNFDVLDIPEIVGGGGDIIPSLLSLSKGGYYARMHCVDIDHLDINKMGVDCKSDRWDFNPCLQYIRKEYSDPTWHWYCGRLPLGIILCNDYMGHLSSLNNYEDGEIK